MKRFLPGSCIELKTVRLDLGVSCPPKAAPEAGIAPEAILPVFSSYLYQYIHALP